jgi:hypothetical protein
MEIRLRPILFGQAPLALCALGAFLARDIWLPAATAC